MRVASEGAADRTTRNAARHNMAPHTSHDTPEPHRRGLARLGSPLARVYVEGYHSAPRPRARLPGSPPGVSVIVHTCTFLGSHLADVIGPPDIPHTFLRLASSLHLPASATQHRQRPQRFPSITPSYSSNDYNDLTISS